MKTPSITAFSAILAALWLGACAPKAGPPLAPPPPGTVATPPDRYDMGLLHLGAAYAAKEGCSCLFVSGRSLAACEQYIKVSPDVAKIRVDMEAKVVRARALGFTSSARWISAREGCRLDPLD